MASRFKLRHSDRSDFRYYENEMVRDEGLLVGADEFDSPPPSDQPLGGEGDVSLSSDFNPFYLSYTSTTVQTVQSFVSGSSANRVIYQTPIESGVSWIKVKSETSATIAIMGTGLQVSAAPHGSLLTIECVGDSLLFSHGSGMNLMAQKPFLMTSGAVLNAVYNATDGLWYETSRSHITEGVV